MIKELFNRFYKNRSIRIKLLLNYIATVLLIVVLLSALNAKNILFEIEGLLDRNTSQLIGQTRNSVEYYIRDLESIIFYLSRDANLEDYIKSSDRNQQSAYEEQVKAILETYTIAHSQIDGLLIAFEDDTIISNNMVLISREPITQDEWYQKAINDSDRLHLFAKPINRNVKNLYDYYSSDNLVSIVKAIKREGEEEPWGVVLIDMKIDGIGDTMEALKQEDSEFFYMVDDQLDVVYAPINKTVYRVNRHQVGSSDGGAFEQTINSKPFKILYEYSPYLNCYFIGVFSLNPLYSLVTAIQSDMIMLALVLLFIGMILTSLLTRTITKPLYRLQRLMKHVEQGELNIHFEVKSNDEVGRLGSGFNQMIYAINNLIQLVEDEQKKKKEAELKAFQAQIKPHFLYNTLDTINWMAQEYEADDISDIVCSLTNLFRLSLSKGKEVIPLRDELEQVESYLKIQMVRYRDKFSYHIECPEQLMDVMVVKLILQPIVENAIYHGIKGSKRFGEINIVIHSDETLLWCEVRDNGNGIDSKILNRINHELTYKEQTYDDMGIGLVNIDERIKLINGQSYGLQTIVSSGEGTRVRIKLPLGIK